MNACQPEKWKFNKSVSNDNPQLLANLNKKPWRSHASSGKFGALLVFVGTFLIETSSLLIIVIYVALLLL